MGAEFNSHVFKDVPRAEIERVWADAVSQNQYESGHSYSGGIGMLGERIKWIDMPPCENQDTAEEWLADKHQKWDCAMAVPFMKDDQKLWLIGGWCSS